MIDVPAICTGASYTKLVGHNWGAYCIVIFILYSYHISYAHLAALCQYEAKFLLIFTKSRGWADEPSLANPVHPVGPLSVLMSCHAQVTKIYYQPFSPYFKNQHFHIADCPAALCNFSQDSTFALLVYPVISQTGKESIILLW